MATPPSQSDTVTRLIDGMRNGDGDAFQQVWDRYYPLVVGVARKNLCGESTTATGASDIAQSTFCALFYGIQENKFSRLSDRHDLRCLLLAITQNKLRATQRKTGNRLRLLRENYPAKQCTDLESQPDLQAQLLEQTEHLLGMLDNRSHLKTVAVAKWHGYTNAEVAQLIGRTVSTVELKLKIIRQIWSDGAQNTEPA